MSTRDSERRLLGLIITEGNIVHFKNGLPLHFNAEEMGLPKIDVNEIAIFYYPTEQDAISDLKKIGAITEDTIIERTKQ